MAYPASPVQGDQVGANLVPRPAFPDNTLGGWSTGSVDPRDIGGGVTRNRLGGFSTTKITLPGAAAGDYKITALLTAPNGAYMGLRRIGSNATAFNVTGATGYRTVTISATVTEADAAAGIELYMYSTTSGQVGLVSVRVDYADSPVSGYFDGDTADTADHVFDWDGTAFASQSKATAGSSYPAPGGGTDPGGDPDPDDGGTDPGDGEGGDPDPVEGSDAAKRVAAFLGRSDDTTLVALAAESVDVVTLMARAYTRGNGFTAGQPNAELAAVITTAAARLVANPEQLRVDVGSVAIRGGWQGWNLAETMVLNRYRVRAR